MDGTFALITQSACVITLRDVLRRPPRSQHLDIVALAHSPARATAPAGVAGPNLSDLPPPPPGSAAFLAPPPYLPPPPELLAGRHGAGRGRLAGKKLPVVIAGMSLLALGCFGALQLASGGESKGPSYPEIWDSRLTELVAFVEQERGLSFEHPIFVDFLPARDIARAARRAGGAPSGEQLELALLEAARLRALGLHAGEADLRAGNTPLAAEDAVPYYDPSTRRMVVPDQPLDASLRIILVHELTHALQDQHFELLGTEAKSTAPDTYRALAEGDAMRIDQRYQAKLSPQDQGLISGAGAQGQGGHRRSRVAASSSLEALRLAPFVLGPSMVDTLFDLDEQGGIDATFRHPPVSDEALLDPSYYRGHGTLRVVPAPPVMVGELVEDEGTLGPMIWYLMLARSGDHAGALKAAFGWGGDRYLVVANGELSCLRVAYRGDSSEDVAEMKTALEGWVASVPGAGRELTSAGDQLVLTACDPGPKAVLPPGINPTDTLLAPRLVMELAVRQHSNSDLTYRQARCVAVAVVAQYSLGDLTTFVSLGPDAVLTPAQEGDLAARTQTALALCP